MSKLDICHIFQVHSHLTFLVALKIIEFEKLHTSDCVLLQTRNYRIPEGYTVIPVYDLLFDIYDQSKFYDENNVELCRENVALLDLFFKKITRDRKFHLYLPGMQPYYAIIMLSSDDCIAYSIIEDGLRHYLASTKDLTFGMRGKPEVMMQCNNSRLLYLGNPRPFCLVDHPKFNQAYVIDNQALPFTMNKSIVGNPFLEEEFEECQNADVFLILSNLQHGYKLDTEPFLKTLQELIDLEFRNKGYKKVIYRLKWLANNDYINHEIKRFLTSQCDIRFVEMPDHYIAENVINKYKLPVYSEYSSVLYYSGKCMGVISYCFAPLYGRNDPKLSKIEAYDDYVSIFSTVCKMINTFASAKQYLASPTKNVEVNSINNNAPNQKGDTMTDTMIWKTPVLHRQTPKVLENDIHIAVVTDENYLSHSCVLIASILGTAKSGVRYHFHLIYAQPFANESQKKLEMFEKQKKINIIRHRIDKARFDNMRLPIAHISQAMYYRFLLPSLIPESVDKVLYLDGDIVVTRDLAELFSTDLGTHYAAVVMQQKTRWCVPPAAGYFNSGMLLLNLQKMRDDDIERKLFEYEAQVRNKLEAPDQDVLNAVFKGNVLWLPFKWNMMTLNNRYLIHFRHVAETTKICTVKEIEEDIANPAVIHFNCEQKPWNTNNDYTSLYWKWAKKTPFYNKKLHDQIMNKTTFSVLAKKTAKFALKPFKPYMQKIVNVASAHHIYLLERSLIEHERIANSIVEVKKQLIVHVNDILDRKEQEFTARLLETERCFETEKQDVVENIRLKCEQEMAVRLTVAEKQFEAEKQAAVKEAVAETWAKLEEIEERIRLQSEKQITVKLAETEKLFEAEKQAAVKEAVAETWAKLEEIEERIRLQSEKQITVKLAETEKLFEAEKQAAVKEAVAETWVKLEEIEERIRLQSEKQITVKLAETEKLFEAEKQAAVKEAVAEKQAAVKEAVAETWAKLEEIEERIRLQREKQITVKLANMEKLFEAEKQVTVKKAVAETEFLFQNDLHQLQDKNKLLQQNVDKQIRDKNQAVRGAASLQRQEADLRELFTARSRRHVTFTPGKMKVCYIGDNRNRLNWGCRATSMALWEMILTNVDLASTIDGSLTLSFPEDYGKYTAYKKFFPDNEETGKRDFVTTDVEKTVDLFLALRDECPHIKQDFEKIKQADAIIINGEGSFIVIETRRDMFVYLTYINLAKRLGKKVFLVNAMFTHYSGMAWEENIIPIVADGLRSCDLVTLRDPMSFQYVKEFAPDANARYVPDALFTWYDNIRSENPSLIKSDTVARTLQEHSFEDFDFSIPYLCVSGTSNKFNYDNPDTIAERYSSLVNRLKALGLPLFLTPTCTGDAFLEKVSTTTQTPLLPVMVPIKTGARILANARCFISGRFHPSILASLGGTPCVFMDSNSHKTLSLQKMLEYENPKEYHCNLSDKDIEHIYEDVARALDKGDGERERISGIVKNLAEEAVLLPRFILGNTVSAKSSSKKKRK